MNCIRRIYVEKKPGADVESRNLYHDLKLSLGIGGLESVRIANCYDISGITEDVYTRCKDTVFAEPMVDTLYEEDLPHGKDDIVFAVKYLPGQYDQRADSAVQCIQILMASGGGGFLPVVESSKVYILGGRLNAGAIAKIKGYLINPVDSMEAPLAKPETLGQEPSEPADIKVLSGFCSLDSDGISQFIAAHGLAMSHGDLLHCQQYFQKEEKREPTISEIKVLDTYWSDHCRHTTFLTGIEKVAIETGKYTAPIQKAYNIYLGLKEKLYGGQRPVTLMNLAQIGAKALKEQGFLADLDESGEINACSITADVDVNGITEKWLVMFKNETHNHPTEIEPFGGAATCLGGAIRDPLSGRVYVYQAMRVTGSGDPRTPVSKTMEGKLPQRKITTEAAHGYSSYGNQIGLATGMVNEIYHEGYVAKRMEIGAVIGAAKAENVIRTAPEPGDIVILVGGRTGRDGCGGATGSSKEHTEESILQSGAEVQKGNPPTERKLQRLFRNPAAAGMIKRCNDFGAGGVSVAIGELSDGLIINLDRIPKKYEGLDGTELAISESQERMAVVVSPADQEKFIGFAAEENLEATVVATVTGDRRLVMSWRGKDIINISRDFLDTNGAPQYTEVSVAAPAEKKEAVLATDIKKAWLDNLSALNVCAQKGLGERFDSTIGAATVLMPFGGQKQLTPAMAMAAKLPVENGDTNTVSLMAYGYDPEVSMWSPFHGAVYAVVDSIGRIVAAGGNPEKIRLSFQEYFEKLGKDYKRWGKPFSALLGGLVAQLEMKAPSIGGKDSMSGSFKDMDVPPTLVSFAVCLARLDHIISPEFKQAGNRILALRCPYDEEGMPDFNSLNSMNQLVHEHIAAGRIVSAHHIGFGGIAAGLSKMAFGNGFGFEITAEDTAGLYQPNYGGFLLETAMDENKINSIFGSFDCQVLGVVTKEAPFIVNRVAISHEAALKAWLLPLEEIFSTEYDKDFGLDDFQRAPFVLPAAHRIMPKKPCPVPKVVIPVFPGSNCEYDTAAAFKKAGAAPEIFVIRNLSHKDLQESIQALADKVKASQIIALPGGFSAGDEPDGSGKYIASVFRNPELSDAVMTLLKNRDGLMIGICNGFQALIKLGLVPFGEISRMEENWPTLTFNQIGRHISCIARTKIVSNKSPWLWGVAPGDVHNVAVSHGEGRFIGSSALIEDLFKKGQVAAQYVNASGDPVSHIAHNPNGSMYAIEGITSPDGRVFGKMGHTERASRGTFKNVAGNTDQKIFISGVQYFS